MASEFDNIVVTGLAAISAAGVGLEPLREALADGVSRLSPVPEEVLGETGHFWGKATAFRAADHMPPLKARKFDRASLFAVVATGMALADAGLDRAGLDPVRTGIMLGCGFGGIANSEEFLRGYFTNGSEGLVPMLFPNTVPNAPASNASIEHGLKGPNVTFVQRFCSAESALFMARHILEEGRADVMVVGGVDELNPMQMRGFRSMGQLFRYAGGFGEGAGLLVLEKADHARRRGARIIAGMGHARTVGQLVPGSEREGVARLLDGQPAAELVSLSGTAADVTLLAERLSDVPRLEIAPLTGRSLAMGGLALVAHLLTLPAGANGLHLAASPEGPYYAFRLRGGDPVQP
ncbi:beta-ketoacyl synthase N-terminal-like domain-containing protein [Geobacter sp. AOG1]|uniref:beta-ketoacyl synthase N-terminal-like domain-containing protein n=1 Tax=Geobacter sp. AOG1 TaxID=1566346 RepID=UPI001CC543BA|nr:beta-ketoacyl synthase N-terminal-like domain-containing protein [Geobacter sp. AOG1]